MSKKFYITTPIYYVNARPHIGHAYTTIACDTIARRQRMMGFDTYFLTGTDEHGQKIERAAQAAGKTPQQLTDEVSAEFRALWDRMGLTYDDFIRTTSDRHKQGVQALWRRIRDNGYIYKGSYTGQYCVFDELYVDVVGPGAPCPECGRPTETVKEENYFFKLSAFQDKLLELYTRQPDFIRPETRRNEVMSFVRSGLRDLSVSRSTFSWGIPVPDDPKHVIYVWLDALANYITALGYGSEDAAKYDKYWPADVQMIGKEIVRFHCVYWPAFLMAAGLPLPQKIVAHGWLSVRRKQNVEVARKHRARRNHPRCARLRRIALFPAARNRLRTGRIVFLRCAGAALQRRSGQRPGQSGQPHADHDHALFQGRSAVSLARRDSHRGGACDRRDGAPEPSRNSTLCSTSASFRARWKWHGAWWARWTNTSSRTQPWALGEKQDDESRSRLATILYTSAEALRIVTALAHPVIPEATAKIWAQLGLGDIQKVSSRRICSGDSSSWGQNSARCNPCSPAPTKAQLKGCSRWKSRDAVRRGSR